MVVPAGGAWLALHLLLLAAKPLLVAMAVTSAPSSWSHHVSTNVTIDVSGEQAQADMPAAEPYYGGQEDIQVGCRELRAKRYISDGFCTSIKPIKEVVCAGHCLPIRDLPWYAEFVKVWARPKLKEWQCEEDVVRRKSVHLLCRNGEYRTYRIKVVKSCKCKRILNKHNRTVTPESKTKKEKNKRKKDKRRRGKKKRRGEKRNRKQGVEEEDEEIDVGRQEQRQEKRRKGRKREKKREEGGNTDLKSGPVGDQVATADDVNSDKGRLSGDPSS